MPWDLSCVVLAGGRGSRLKRDKILETVGDRNLLERVVSVINSFNSNIIVVTAKGQTFPQLTRYPMLKVVADIYPQRGVLGGLYTGLVTSNSLYNLVVASDLPFLNQGLLRYMILLADGFDAVIPRLGNMIEPLHAVYSKSCMSPLEWLLKKGNLKTSNILPFIRVRYVEAQEIDRFDPKHLSLFNVNTESDLARARELAGGNVSEKLDL